MGVKTKFQYVALVGLKPFLSFKFMFFSFKFMVIIKHCSLTKQWRNKIKASTLVEYKRIEIEPSDKICPYKVSRDI